MNVPTINTQYACIVDREAISLAALISSYLFVPGSYLPVLLLRRVKLPRAEDAAFMSESYLANAMGDEDGTLVSNALARMRETKYIILAGLSEAQKSYLHLPNRSKIIDIADVPDIEPSLSHLRIPTKGELRCRTSDLLNGLFIAQKQQKRLVIDEGAPPVPEVVHLENGLVLVENVADASPVVAVNYASSVGASILIVDCLPEDEGRNVQNWIKDWKEKNDHQQFEKLKDAVWQRIHGISFSRFEYVTFFTEGPPYSLILENIIPCSYVHLSMRPDLFVLNSIMFRDGEHFHAAVVFSPTFFPDEETDFLCDALTKKKLYVRSLIGESASLAKFDFHAQFFPYDLLHVCSHGGEVDGYEMSEQFTDRDGHTHNVEFDEVIGFTPVPDKPGIVAVHRKIFPRKLDGFDWMSAELAGQKVPGHVILDMWKCIVESQGTRKKKDQIAMSCAVACADSIHQGSFYTVASHSSPLMFNNSCWSWHEVAAFFLACGARGYIGTLWAIDNEAAVIAAKTFYEYSFSGSVLSAFHKALKAIDATASKDIYIYWGLHFSTLAPGHSFAESQNRVQEELIRAVKRWVRKIKSTKSAEIKGNSIKILKSILQELAANCNAPDVRKLEAQVKDIVPELTHTEISRDTGQLKLPARRSSLDYSVEYREASEQRRRAH